MARNSSSKSAPPSDDEVHALLQSIITRRMKLLTRRGVLVEDMGQTCLAEPDAEADEARVLRERHRPPPPPAVPRAGTSPGPLQRGLLAVGRAIGRSLRRLAGALLGLGPASRHCAPVRRRANAPTLRLLDRAEARLAIGWERLLQRMGRR